MGGEFNDPLHPFPGQPRALGHIHTCRGREGEGGRREGGKRREVEYHNIAYLGYTGNLCIVCAHGYYNGSLLHNGRV